MTSQRRSFPDSLHTRVLRDVFTQWGYPEGEYAWFFTMGQGEFLPIGLEDDEVEETSGYLATRTGQHFRFWFGWDAEKQTPTLKMLEAATPEPWWFQSAEYIEARTEVGLGDY